MVLVPQSYLGWFSGSFLREKNNESLQLNVLRIHPLSLLHLSVEACNRFLDLLACQSKAHDTAVGSGGAQAHLAKVGLPATVALLARLTPGHARTFAKIVGSHPVAVVADLLKYADIVMFSQESVGWIISGGVSHLLAESAFDKQAATHCFARVACELLISQEKNGSSAVTTPSMPTIPDTIHEVQQGTLLTNESEDALRRGLAVGCVLAGLHAFCSFKDQREYRKTQRIKRAIDSAGALCAAAPLMFNATPVAKQALVLLRKAVGISAQSIAEKIVGSSDAIGTFRLLRNDFIHTVKTQVVESDPMRKQILLAFLSGVEQSMDNYREGRGLRPVTVRWGGRRGPLSEDRQLRILLQRLWTAKNFGSFSAEDRP